MKKVIVTTTINEPTKAIQRFDQMPDWSLIVIGDRKTPPGYRLENGRYISPEEQASKYPELSDLIGWNCIQRRNIGFLYALELGADYIATIDDDNIPDESWGEILIRQEIEAKCFEVDTVAFDPLSVTEYPHLWHRGYPLQDLTTRKNFKSSVVVKKFDVQANLWNGDPDIDAICRMEHGPDVKFKSFKPFTANKISPFNSQNTILTREALKNYFMFTEVGRMDDIWASFYLLSKGFNVLYCDATVRQDRNVHDLTIDFNKEIIGYQNNKKLITDLYANPDAIQSYIPEKSWLAFNEYKKISHSL